MNRAHIRQFWVPFLPVGWHLSVTTCCAVFRCAIRSSCSTLIPTRTISASTQVQGGDFNLYENMRCHGVPLVTISRGRVVYENGVFMCAEGTGKFCPLRSFPDIVYKKLVQREKVRRAGRKMCGKRSRPILGASSLPPLTLRHCHLVYFVIYMLMLFLHQLTRIPQKGKSFRNFKVTGCSS